MYWYSLNATYKYTSNSFKVIATGYTNLIEAAIKLNAHVPVMISMADLKSVGALSAEELARYGNAVENLKSMAISLRVSVKTSTFPAEVAQVATRLVNPCAGHQS